MGGHMDIKNHFKKISALNLASKVKGITGDERWGWGAKVMSNDVYHGTKHSVSSSMIKDLVNDDVSDHMVYQKHIKKALELPPTQPFIIGRATHTMILEKKLFDREYCIYEGKVRRGKEYDAFKELNTGKEVLNTKEFELISDIRQAVMNNPVAKALFKGGKAEYSVFYRDPITDLICKARADYLGAGYIADLKSIDDVCPRNFGNQVVKYGYHIQAAFYMRAFGVDEFVFVCVGKKAPYEVAIYSLSDELIEMGHLQIDQALEHLKECKQNKVWEGFNTDKDPIKEITAPKWFASKIIGA
jgi:hypothetical protein